MSRPLGTLLPVLTRAAVQGIAFPAIHSLISASVPRSFQSSAVAIVTAASYGGAALASGVAPLLIDASGWPSVFYVFGASALLWLPLWLLVHPPDQASMGSDSQSSSQTAQRQDSSGSIAQTISSGTEQDQSGAEGEQARSSGLTSASNASGMDVRLSNALGLDQAFWALAKRREVWAICAAQYCQSWGMYALLNWLPTFFSEQVWHAHMQHVSDGCAR